MKRLLQINSVVNSGSTGRIAEEIGQTAINYGWQSYIAYGRNPKESKSELIRIGSNLDVKLHGIKTRLFDKHGLGSKKATKRLIKEIQNINPDIIHLHNIHGYYINIKILFDFLKEYNKPVVWTFHDCWPYTGHCTHYADAKCNKWKTHCESCPLKTSYPKSIFLDRSFKNYDFKKSIFTSLENLTIVAVSDWLKSDIEKSFMNKYPILRIYNGVDIDYFKPYEDYEYVKLKYSIPKDKNVLLACATSWSNNKGFLDYIKLSKMLNKDYVIVLVGLPSKLIKKLPNNIIGIPITYDIEELAKLYSLSSIVLNLSKQESFGKTTVEGLACGTPGIVYDVTASPELIDSETGIVVQKDDISQVCEAIYEIERWNKSNLQIKCRDRAKSFFDKNINFMKYIDLYKSLL